jgi:hypothetical protein
LLGRHVAAVFDPHWVEEMLVQMIDIFENPLIE